MTNVFFIIDGQKLEAQAHFLVASILDHMMEGCRVLAYVRPDAVLPPSLAGLLEKANVEVRKIPGLYPDPWARPYVIGNKLLAAADEREGEVAAFIDTDTIFCTTVDFSSLLQDAAVGAVLSDYKLQGVRNSKQWQTIFDFLDAEMPSARAAPFKRPTADYPPYFNAGMVVFKERVPHHDRRVGEEWLRMSLDFDHRFDPLQRGIPRGKIDQVTLAALGPKLKYATRILPQRFNFNVMGWGAPPEGQCAIAHYHVLDRLWKAPSVGRPVLLSLKNHLGADGFGRFVDDYQPHLHWKHARRLLS